MQNNVFPEYFQKTLFYGTKQSQFKSYTIKLLKKSNEYFYFSKNVKEQTYRGVTSRYPAKALYK